MDREEFDKIEKFLKLPDSQFRFKAEFVTNAVKEKIAEIEKKHAFDEDHRMFNNELKKHEEQIKKLSKELKYFKKEYAHEEKYEKHGKLEKSLDKAWINWNLDRKLLPRSIRSMASAIKTKFYNNGGIILNKEDMKNLTFGKILKEARGIITADMIENLINHSDKKRKCLYLLQSCSAMRIGELLQLKKKHFDFTKDRIQVNLSASMTKSGESRITFVSKECEKILLPILKRLEDNDRVFPNKIASEQHAFRRIAENAGFEETYETTGRSKISTHTLRAYAITQMNKLNLFGFGHIIAGHGFYMKTYNRPEPEQLLEDYIKAEPYLQIFGREDPTIKKTIGELQLQIKKLQENQEKIVMLSLNPKQYQKDYNLPD